MKTDVKPFIKWAGGKSKLIAQYAPYLPVRCNTYYEPFLGGGAMFFHVARARAFAMAEISDANLDLISVYDVIAQGAEALHAFCNQVNGALEAWNLNDDKQRRAQYERARAVLPVGAFRRAVRFMFLNRTCFNGLYRVNKRGEFNVPMGRYARVPLLSPVQLGACSAVLRSAVIRESQWDHVMRTATRGDFVYFDPPYIPVKDDSFTAYTALDVDHVALATAFTELVDRGVRVLLSNSDTPVTRALYAGHKIVEIQARRSVNSNAAKRGPVGELLIVGGE